MSRRSALTRLVLRGNRLNTACGALLAAGLRKAPTLTSLSLCGCNLSSASGKAITDALQQNASLTFVSTADNKLGPLGKRMSEVMSQNATLNMTDAGLRKALESGGFRHAGLSVLSLPPRAEAQLSATAPGSLPSITQPGQRKPMPVPKPEGSRLLRDPTLRLPLPPTGSAAAKPPTTAEVSAGGFLTEVPPLS